MEFTRPALWALTFSAGLAMLGDASEAFGERPFAVVVASGLAAFAGLALAIMGTRESGGEHRRRFARWAAAAWAASLVLVALGNLEYAGAPLVRALGGAAFATSPVLAVWTLGHRLPRVVLAAAAAFLALAYLAGAAFEMAGVRTVALTLPGDLGLFAGYWMTLRTYRSR